MIVVTAGIERIINAELSSEQANAPKASAETLKEVYHGISLHKSASGA